MGDTGSFYFGNFRAGQRHGLGLLFVPLQSPQRKGQDPSAASFASSSSNSGKVGPASRCTMDSFSIHAAIWRNDAVHACWVAIASAAGVLTSAASSTAAAASSSQPFAVGSNEQFVWQAVQRLLRHAVPAVLRMQHHLLSAAASASASVATGSAIATGPLSASSQAANAISTETQSVLSRFASATAFRLVSVPNAVHTLRKSAVCSYRVTGELGCAEQPYICVTCAEADRICSTADGQQRGCGWEICQACAETTKCHSGHTLKPLVRRASTAKSVGLRGQRARGCMNEPHS